MPDPDQPIVAVLAVVVRGTEVLLVRRANPPDAGLWGFPGGKVSFGETLEQAAQRELREETGVEGAPRHAFTALDVFERDAARQLRRHFVLVAVLCDWRTGEPQAADDALEAQWFPVSALDPTAIAMSADVDRVARLALEFAPI